MTFTLTSTVFQEGAIIPDKHTCSGQDVSPPLQWSAPPKGTRSFALIMDDPDAPIGTWVHWVIFNIPSQSSSLPEGVPPKKTFPTGEHQGINDFKRIGYGGPCPPPGKPHRYYLKLYGHRQDLAVLRYFPEYRYNHLLLNWQLPEFFCRSFPLHQWLFATRNRY